MGDVIQIYPPRCEVSEVHLLVQRIDTSVLKRWWDAYEHWEKRDLGCHMLEAIYFEMQNRGEGSYVAV